MSPTYELIDSITLSSDQSSVSFNNIPQTYDDLEIISSSRTNRGNNGDSLVAQFNGDTGNNYSNRTLYGTGSSAVSTSFSSVSGIYFTQGACGNNDTANTFGNSSAYIPNYTSSVTKTASHHGNSETNATASYMDRTAGIWTGTSAITTILLKPLNGTLFLTGSTFELYGIKNADDGSEGYFGPAARGGDEVYTTGDGYKVHVFKTSGTLEVTAPGEVEYLVIAGGGGGGSDRGGGGGAGGYRSSVGGENSGGGSPTESKFNLNVGNKSIIVGAGGIGNNFYTAGTSGSNSSIDNIISYGGGGGGSGDSGVNNGATGGSGGGGGTNGTGGSPVISQGYGGGDALATDAGGGGGAGSVGANGTSVSGGNGGAGISSSVTGSSIGRAGGGGGGGPSGDSGGSATDGGGSGIGGDTGTGGTSATINTGGGGGGGTGGTLNLGGNGGSGIVIIRYKV